MPPSSSFNTLLPTLTTALRAFQSSPTAFRVVHTLNASSTVPSRLLILDSSFNAPQLAHKYLITSALASRPYDRLLLLLSVNNADKAPAPAPFATRLALMALFAADITPSVQIDIGLTTEAFYNAKSAAIEAAEYAPGAKHTHLMGFDTLVRFMAPRYYKDHEPPLSALDAFFGAGHGVRVTIRPGEGGEVQAQEQWREEFANGSLEAQGGRREWAAQIEIAEACGGEGISSTLVRRAAERGDWGEVEKMCSPSVARAIREKAIYSPETER